MHITYEFHPWHLALASSTVHSHHFQSGLLFTIESDVESSTFEYTWVSFAHWGSWRRRWVLLIIKINYVHSRFELTKWSKNVTTWIHGTTTYFVFWTGRAKNMIVASTMLLISNIPVMSTLIFSACNWLLLYGISPQMGDINANLASYFLRLDKENTEEFTKEITWRDEPFDLDDFSKR